MCKYSTRAPSKGPCAKTVRLHSKQQSGWTFKGKKTLANYNCSKIMAHMMRQSGDARLVKPTMKAADMMELRPGKAVHLHGHYTFSALHAHRSANMYVAANNVLLIVI